MRKKPELVDAKELGKRVRAIRKALRLTITETTEQTGICRTTLSNIERGTKTPSLDTLVKLSTLLNCSIDYILLGNIPTQQSTNEDTGIQELTEQEEKLLKSYNMLEPLEQKELQEIIILKLALRSLNKQPPSEQ